MFSVQSISVSSNEGAGLFGEQGEDFIRRLDDAERVFLRLEGNRGKTHDAVFDMAGVEEAAERVAAACGFSLIELSREDYRSIQGMLNNAGFDAGTPDGIWGRGSQAVMRAFQQANDLEATGAPDRETLRAMGIEF